MSLSNNTELQSPCTRYFEWAAQTGQIKYWDKSRGEKGENVFVKLPFTFIVLDILSTVKGFSDETQGGIWSNEVRDTRKDSLTVRTKRGVMAQGVYQDIKGAVQGVRFTQSVYIAYKGDDKQLVIGNFQMSGVANSEFIEFRKNHKIYGNAIVITGSDDRTKGATKYKAPVFELKETSPETIAEAVELDKELQEYLKVYLSRNQDTSNTPSNPANQALYGDDGFTGAPPYLDEAPNAEEKWAAPDDDPDADLQW